MNRSPRDNSHPPRDGELAGATAGLQALVKQLRERQAKLERDNERLRDERDELRRAQTVGELLADPVGRLTIGVRSFILRANVEASRLLHMPTRDLVRSRLTRFIMRNSRRVFERRRTMVLERGEPQSCEVQLLRRGSSSFWAQLDLSDDRSIEARAAARGVSIE